MVAIVGRPSTISGQVVAVVSSAPNRRANSRPVETLVLNHALEKPR
jgi:hypothetical protein